MPVTSESFFPEVRKACLVPIIVVNRETRVKALKLEAMKVAFVFSLLRRTLGLGGFFPLFMLAMMMWHGFQSFPDSLQ